MTEIADKTYVNVVLDEREASLLEIGKEKSGIRSTSEFVRHLIASYANAS